VAEEGVARGKRSDVDVFVMSASPSQEGDGAVSHLGKFEDVKWEISRYPPRQKKPIQLLPSSENRSSSQVDQWHDRQTGSGEKRET